MPLKYISEEEFRKNVSFMIEESAKMGNLKIFTPEKFVEHLIDVGRKSFNLAKNIIGRHPSLSKMINPDLVRVAGYMHDIGKINYGDPYHEIFGANIVLEEGEKINLVSGGTSKERGEILGKIALCILSDFVMDMEIIEGEMIPRFNSIAKKIFDSGLIKTKEEIFSPNSLERQILIYADLTNSNGEMIPRFKEMIERYETYIEKFNSSGDKYLADYYSRQIEFSRKLMGRFIAVEGLIGGLVGES